MPTPNLDTVKSRVDTLSRTLSDKGKEMDAAELRETRKKLRRAQRKHRRMTVRAERLAGKPKAEAEQKPAPEAETKPEPESKEESAE